MKKRTRNPRSRLGKMRMRYCLTVAGIFLGLCLVLTMTLSMLNLLLDPSPYVRLFSEVSVVIVSLWLTERYITKNMAQFLLQDQGDTDK